MKAAPVLNQFGLADVCKFLTSSPVLSSRKDSVTDCQTAHATCLDISQLNPTLQNQWHCDKNAHLGGIVVERHRNRKVWWRSHQCPDGHAHEWEASMNTRSNGAGCPFCIKSVCKHNSLATLAPDVAAQFSHKTPGSPHDFLATSNRQVTWKCELDHEWLAQICSRTSRDHSGCPICHNVRRRGPRKQQPILTDSLHPIMQGWDWELNFKAGFHPSRITCRSGIKANWVCQKCPRGQPHRWQARSI